MSESLLPTIFKAEITEVKAKKLASGDKEFKLTLITNDPKCLSLQQYIAEDVVTVEVKHE